MRAQARVRTSVCPLVALRQVVAQEGGAAGVRISLGAASTRGDAAQLGGFHARALKAKASEAQPQLLYATEWREQVVRRPSSAAAPGGETSLLILGVSAGLWARRSCKAHRQAVRTAALPARAPAARLVLAAGAHGSTQEP